MLRSLRSSRCRAAALGLLAATAAVPLVIAPQIPAAAAMARAASTGFGRATEIAQPGNAAADIDSILIGVACTGYGYCSAGGSYTDSLGNGQAMVVTESRGTWGPGVEVKLPPDAASDPYAEVNGVACTSPGNCVAVGYYRPAVGDDSGFIVSQRGGTWGRAVAATPLPAGTTGSWLYAVACPASGSCEAVGDVLVGSATEGIVLTQARGKWTRKQTLSAPVGGPDLSGIACIRPGDCVADGFYFPTDSETVYDAIGYVESRGKWSAAATVRAPKNDTGTETGLTSAACLPDGSCLGAGGYAVGSSGYAMAAPVSGGKWRAATEILALPPHAVGADLYGVSCASSRLCVGAGGYGTTTTDELLAYLVSYVSGRWKDAGTVTLPANATISPVRSFFYAVGCASDGYCAAVGDYHTKPVLNVASSGEYVPMVATRS